MDNVKRLVAILMLGCMSVMNAHADLGDVLLELDIVGKSVAVDGDIALFGSPFRRTVYAYDIQTGEHISDLKVDERVPGFGGTIRLDGTTAIVSGHGVEAAYLFDVTNGGLLHKLVPEDPHDDQDFGVSLAIDDGVALVGASNDNEWQDRGGAAYVFDVSTGEQLRKITPDVPFPRAGLIPWFGGSLALENGIAVIGESNSEIVDGRFAIGGAYVFDIDTGQQLRKLKGPAGPTTHDLFGSSIDINSGRVLVGVSGTNEACPGLNVTCWSGSAFVFDISSGDVLQKLKLSDGRQSDQFGAASVLEGDVAIVAGRNAAENAYFFDVATGNPLLEIPDGEVFAAADGKAVVVGRGADFRN